MILECDVGNTRCKWRLINATEITAAGGFAHRDGLCWPSLSGVNRVRIVSVVAPDVLKEVAASLIARGLKPELAATASNTGGVRCGYVDIAKLGVDRWSALVAAYQRCNKAVLVLDAGSALTVDLVDDEGSHLGGYIVPGQSLMKSSLLKDTANVSFDSNASPSGLDFGVNTATCVSAGILASQVGTVSIAIDEARRRIGQDFAILLTGGDAEVILHHLPEVIADQIMWVPDLVMDGLKYLLP
ncbi:type III pantothenate kinase [Oceanicoccus sp. KOV_DT_Chl]|uniref:type III pantothenate kinase n=1 Tax=Oceanicoccus sp. KOV_DT_Chl TaxID=1904639 RepID=UPI000C79C648|nr:type III pantothenate kinase [Oceanicoccus sp. KOV_DT_Chl]